MIPTLLTVALLAAPTLAAQDVSVSTAPEEGQEGWLDFDGVALILAATLCWVWEAGGGL